MRKLHYRLSQKGVIILLIFYGFIFIPRAAMADRATLKTIFIREDPLSIEFSVTRKVPVKVIQIEKKEVLVALKNVDVPRGLKIKGRKGPAIRDISIESLEGDVVAVVVSSFSDYGPISSGFDKAGSNFILHLNKKSVSGSKKLPQEAGNEAKSPPKAEKPVSNPAPAQPAPEKVGEKMESGVQETRSLEQTRPLEVEKPKVQKPAAKGASLKTSGVQKEKSVKISTPPPYVPPKREKSEYRGDISDLYRVINRMECDSREIQNAIIFIKKDLYQKAFELLDQYVFNENLRCIEQVHFLRAFAYYKSLEKKDSEGLLKAERMFQETLISYPRSPLVPFAYASIGMIHTALNNHYAAEGYFNIVKQGYQGYPGMPEVLFHLAEIYTRQGYTDKALRYYKEVFESTVENSYIPDAGFGYGRALFAQKQFYNALTLYNYLVKRNVKQVYKSPDLLLQMGDANFELGLSKAARENYIRGLNLFPEIPDRDVILSKVGDTYGLENNSEKAIKFYELVREKFPDTQGFINSSIGIARYLETDQEKIDIYEMVKTKFPENTYARIAMMRLAEIYQKNGEYNKCIKEIEDLLSTHPRGLRYEAVKLMQRAYEALFEKQMKEDGYTRVLNRYEAEQVKIGKMGSRKVEFSVGMAYLTAGLHEQAFNHLINAYKQYKRSERSPELLFGLGLAMDESGRDEDAVKLFSGFSKRFPKNRKRVEALTRMGTIYFEKSDFKRSGDSFKRAYAASRDYIEKGEILLLHSNVYERNKDLKTTVNFREKAIKDFAAAPGKNYEILTEAYKILGETRIQLGAYARAADAFSKALSFSEGERAKANLGFLLGDAYQKGNIMDKAKQAFEQVADNYDSVWARLARQRLTTLDLAQTVQNS
ncbi:tetratricopeptide repeat protein [Desulfospira joergensenii]|uniref:tetratricopeptide repeat protein n=1 Tax=Desulfospira joergensenii TaxID=53329 RepID=UPI0003B5A371|nr:tetratricopeptide repeat protein [Desulfospira joergensenii]